MSILTIALCGVICGTNTWVDIENFGYSKREWLEKHLDLPYGIPSHDTFGCVFERLDAEQFQACFVEWMQSVNEHTHGQVLPIDASSCGAPTIKRMGRRQST